MTTPLSWVVCHPYAVGLAMDNLRTRPKFEVFIFTDYEDRKGDAKSRNLMVSVVTVTRGH